MRKDSKGNFDGYSDLLAATVEELKQDLQTVLNDLVKKAFGIDGRVPTIELTDIHVFEMAGNAIDTKRYYGVRSKKRKRFFTADSIASFVAILGDKAGWGPQKIQERTYQLWTLSGHSNLLMRRP